MQFPTSHLTFVRTIERPEQQTPVPERLAAFIKRMNATPSMTEAPTLRELRDQDISLAKSSGGKLGSSTVADLEHFWDVQEKEAKLTEQNGFRRTVTPALTKLYHRVQSESINPTSFKSDKEATDSAANAIMHFQNHVFVVNRFGGGDPAVGGTYKGAFSGPVPDEKHYNVMNAQMKDYLESSRMNLVIESKILAETFGIKEPIYEVKDGNLQIRSFDIEYNGKKLLRSVGGGDTAEYRSDGTLKLNKTV